MMITPGLYLLCSAIYARPARRKLPSTRREDAISFRKIAKRQCVSLCSKSEKYGKVTAAEGAAALTKLKLRPADMQRALSALFGSAHSRNPANMC